MSEDARLTQRDDALVFEGDVPSKKEGWLHRNHSLVVGNLSVVIFLSLWQFIVALRVVPPLFLPGPVDIFEAGIEMSQHPLIWKDLQTSGQEFVVGYLAAVITAVPFGLLTGWYPKVRQATDPFVNFLYATPKVVLLPLFIIWFGIGINSKIALVYLGAFFSIIINTAAGVRNIDPHLVKVARSFGASDIQMFRTVALPGSVPFILTGLRLGIGHALIAVVVGELVAAQFGIGLRIAIAGATFQTAKVFAGVTLVATTGMLTTMLLGRLESRFDSWRPRERE